MASYHFQINTGGKGTALEHAQYIDRDGRFTEERYGEVAARGVANMPEWAREDTAEFWRASDEYERANGNTYREYELALPRELLRSAQVALVQRFAEQELGTTRPYQWAIHTCTASDGREQPHVHLMFSDRQQDGIERGPEQFFKRYNAKNPERGGARKFSYGADKEEAARTYEGIRERWAKVQNLALEHAGVEARVDHRSLSAQGIHREPEVHRGPAVSGIEGRGKVSEVGERQREQRQERVLEREAVVAEVRVVTREEMALERVAARERRDLAREVTGPDRALVLPRVEADRREQLGRAQAQAERRVERRQGLKIGGRLGEKLITQARALRERIGRELERVKEWVRERFPDPLKQLKERSREVFEAALEKARGRRPARAQEPEKEPERDQKPDRFKGLKLKPRGIEAQRQTTIERPVVGRAVEAPAASRGSELIRALDGFARAWSDAARMRDQELPILEHQRAELRKATAVLERVRPGVTLDLLNAVKYEPATVPVLKAPPGAQRSNELLATLEREAKVRTNPELKAERVVKVWQSLEAEHQALKGYSQEGPRQRIENELQSLTREIKADPELGGRVLKLQLSRNISRRLERVLEERDLKRALNLSIDLGRGRGLSL
jgi:MobA/MobL family